MKERKKWNPKRNLCQGTLKLPERMEWRFYFLEIKNKVIYNRKMNMKKKYLRDRQKDGQ